MAAIRAHAEE